MVLIKLSTQWAWLCNQNHPGAVLALLLGNGGPTPVHLAPPVYGTDAPKHL